MSRRHHKRGRTTPSPRTAVRRAAEQAARQGCNCRAEYAVLDHLGGDCWEINVAHDDWCALLQEFGDHSGLLIRWPSDGGDAA